MDEIERLAMSEPETNNAAELQPTFSSIVRRYELDLATINRQTFTQTIAVIDDLRQHCKATGLLASQHPVPVVEHWYTRLAVALTTWAVHPSTNLSLAELKQIVRRKNEFVYIFAASGYRNMLHLMALLNKSENPDEITIEGKKVPVLLALMGLDDLNDEMINLALGTQPNILLQLLLGWMNQRAILTARGEDNRARLISAGAYVEGATIDDSDIGMIVNAYMYTSYASAPDKHNLKETFNTLMARRLEAAGCTPTQVYSIRETRPIVVLPLERFTHKHAMFRAFYPYIHRLRDHFQLIAVVEEENIDQEAEGLFDSVIKLPKGKRRALREIIKVIEELTPDIIYYPSLGMSHWTVMLSNLRLARLQMLSQGHPATSRSPVIDYVFVPNLEGDPTAVYSEVVLMGEGNVVFEKHADLPDDIPERVAPSDREVRVAVVSKVMKLSHRLMQICVRLTEEAARPVRFSFFPGEQGWYSDGISAAIKQQLPDANVYPYQDYQKYLTYIAKCDLALAAFPFGNTNSTVDTALLGIPTVAHFGPECPAQTDKWVLDLAGFPDWLVCNDDDAYYRTALKLINEPETLAKIAKQLSPEHAKTALVAGVETGSDREMAELFIYAYRNHDVLKKNNTKVIRHSDTFQDPR